MTANKKPGRPKREFPPKTVWVKIEPEIFKMLSAEGEAKNFYKAGKPNISRVIREILKERYY